MLFKAKTVLKLEAGKTLNDSSSIGSSHDNLGPMHVV